MTWLVTIALPTLVSIVVLMAIHAFMPKAGTK